METPHAEGGYLRAGRQSETFFRTGRTGERCRGGAAGVYKGTVPAEAERIAIVGLGLMGGSLALALRRARPMLSIIGVDVDARAREQALQEGAVHTATGLDEAALEVCDFVVLCVPAQPLLELIPAIAKRMRAGAVLTDVCGAKEMICAAGAAQDRAVFVGAHPMAGTEYR